MLSSKHVFVIQGAALACYHPNMSLLYRGQHVMLSSKHVFVIQGAACHVIIQTFLCYTGGSTSMLSSKHVFVIQGAALACYHPNISLLYHVQAASRRRLNAEVRQSIFRYFLNLLLFFCEIIKISKISKISKIPGPLSPAAY